MKITAWFYCIICFFGAGKLRPYWLLTTDYRAGRPRPYWLLTTDYRAGRPRPYWLLTTLIEPAGSLCYTEFHD